MSRGKKIYMILTLVVLLVIMILYKQNAMRQYENNLAAFVTYQQNARSFITLDQKYNKIEAKKTVENIKKIFHPFSFEKHSMGYRIVFKNLNQSTFERLGKIVLNSSLIIEKLEIQKDKNKESVSCVLEIKL